MKAGEMGIFVFCPFFSIVFNYWIHLDRCIMTVRKWGFFFSGFPSLSFFFFLFSFLPFVVLVVVDETLSLLPQVIHYFNNGNGVALFLGSMDFGILLFP